MFKPALLSLVFALSATASEAADITVQVQNLTRGTQFAPLMIAAHADTTKSFTVGNPASANLQKMAEGGDISGLVADMSSAGAVVSANPASGLLAPGAVASATLMTTASQSRLSVLGMMVPTNDGFIALNAMMLPTTPGTYSYDVNAYDAGTEANDEIRGGGAPGVRGMPVPGPLDAMLGKGGTGIDATAEGFVHIHRGVIGDSDANGGKSDLDAARHRWLNPVARVTVIVK